MPSVRSERLLRLRTQAHRFTRRRRRPIAAGLAAAGVLMALGSLRPPPTPAAEKVGQGSTASRIGPGEVAVPIVLSTPGLVGSLSRGQLVDVVGVPRTDDAAAAVIAAAAA